MALGTFDGFHIGHQHLIRKLEATARKYKLRSILVTLSAPVRRSSLLLTSLDEKLEILKRQPLNEIIVLHTGTEVTSMPARLFFDDFLIKQLNVKHIVVGANFAFGHNREGDIAWLKKACASSSIKIDAVNPVKYHGEVVSSSRIRALLHEGNVNTANTLLGRAYSITGLPQPGLRIGRKLGFPTVNLAVSPGKLLPPGIFAGVTLRKNKFYPSIVNIGTRPSIVEKGSLLTEIHLLDYKGNWPREKTQLFLLKHLRAEKKFNSMPALAKQIEKDRNKARVFFNND